MTLLDDVEAWCATLPARRPLHLLNVRPTADELAAHPQSLHTQAYFAGARHAAGEHPQRFPRPLTADEAECWADGWAEHQDDALEARHHTPTPSTRGSLLGILDTDQEAWQAHGSSPVADGPVQEAS